MSTPVPPKVPRPKPDIYNLYDAYGKPWRPSYRSGLLILAVLALLLAAILLAVGGVAADGPVIWKAQCPRHHQVLTVPTSDPGGGVHVLCVRQAEEAGER